MMKAFLIFALVWHLPWTIPAGNPPGTEYVAERYISAPIYPPGGFGELGGMSVPLDTFTTATNDSFAGMNGVLFNVRGAWIGAPDVQSTGTFRLLSCDWSNNVQPTKFDTMFGRTYVAAWLPTSKWRVTFTFADSIPTAVFARCVYDWNGDGLIDFADLVHFFNPFNGNLSDLAAFGILYHQPGRYTWTLAPQGD